MATSTPPRQGNQAQQHQQAGARRRILRIGILLNRTLVEERQMRERSDISIGQSAKNTFSIPLENLPRQFNIFTVENERYRLNFTTGMDGRISDGGQPMRLDDLRAKGAENRGEYWSWPLSESTRGKIEMGDFTLLFQFVAEPPRQPKPMLPASVRGTLADRLDPRLSAILAVSIMLHFAVAVYAKYFVDPERDGSLTDQAYNLTFKQDEYTIKLDEPVDPNAGVGSAAATEPAKAEAPKKDPGGDKGPKKDPDAGDNDTSDAAALQEEAIRRALALTGEDAASGGLLGDDNRRSPGSDLGKQLDAAREAGGQVALGGNSGRGTRGDGDPRVGTGKGPGVGTGGVDSAGGDKVEKGPTGRVSVSEKSGDDESSLTPDAVLAKIMSAYMAGLKRCYKDYLKKDPAARGKVSLSFTVNETGRSVSNKASSGDLPGEVTSCIQTRMDGWRFPIPKDGDGEPTDASFTIKLQMVPD
jgi:hypothetical protein